MPPVTTAYINYLLDRFRLTLRCHERPDDLSTELIFRDKDIGIAEWHYIANYELLYRCKASESTAIVEEIIRQAAENIDRWYEEHGV
jgi:hypothetical protein